MTEFGRNGRLSRSSGTVTPEQSIAAELGRGENLIWAGRPTSIGQHAHSEIPSALFGVPFFAIAIFWIWGASAPLRRSTGAETSGFEYFLPVFGIPFLSIGLVFILSPAWKVFQARGMSYALTDQRLIIRETIPFTKVNSWSLDSVERLSRTGPAEGPGCLFFAEELVRNRGRVSFGSSKKQIGFIGIDQPKQLEDKIRSLIKEK